MDINKKIVKSLLEKNYSDMKDLVYKSLYAKASLLMDEERVAVADVLFNEGSGGIYDDDESAAAAPAKKKSAVSNPGNRKVTDSDEIASIQRKRDRKRASQA